MKKASVLKKFDRLNSELEILLAEMEKNQEGKLFKSPSPGAWSPVQVLQHLILTESSSLKYLQKKISSGLKQIPPATWLTAARVVAFRLYIALPLKTKAPQAMGEAHFPEVASFEEVAGTYRKTRKELRNFLENLPEEAFALEIFRHPAVGKLALDGLVTFFVLHFKRHERQIRRQLD
jgi:hypothetical protein